MSAFEIVAVPEYAISNDVNSQLRILLEDCFPGWFDGRTYVKQLPHVRLLAMDGQSVVGQVAIDSRVINVGGTVVSIFGLIDLAVNPSQRGKRIGTTLLAEAERTACTYQREFLIVMADRHDIYMKSGYHRVQPALTKLLAIEDRQSAALIERDLSDCFLAKPLTERMWPAGMIDLLGYVF